MIEGGKTQKRKNSKRENVQKNEKKGKIKKKVITSRNTEKFPKKPENFKKMPRKILQIKKVHKKPKKPKRKPLQKSVQMVQDQNRCRLLKSLTSNGTPKRRKEIYSNRTLCTAALTECHFLHDTISIIL